MAGPVAAGILVTIGGSFLVYSGALLLWTTLIRSRTNPEPPWVIRLGCGSTIAAFVFAAAGLIVAVTTL